MTAREQINWTIEEFRKVERDDPTWPRFNEKTLPVQAPGESELAWAFRAFEHLASWRDELRRRAVAAATIKVASIASIYAVNGERDAS